MSSVIPFEFEKSLGLFHTRLIWSQIYRVFCLSKEKLKNLAELMKFRICKRPTVSTKKKLNKLWYDEFL